MSKIHIGINLEFVRHNDKPFEWGVEKAAELGYTHVEPMVHLGRELLSEAGYFHSVSMLDDPLRIKRACERAGVAVSDLSAFVPHQANLRIIETIARKLGVPRERLADDIVHAGNTSSASIPLALSRMAERGDLKPGSAALLLGFGAGLCYAAQVITVP